MQLDAAVMHGPTHNAGAVACLENIVHASAVARLVMERTDHVLLVGRGAYEFARAHGFPDTNLLTDESRKTWLKWKEELSPDDDWLQPPAPEKKSSRLDAKNARLERTLAYVRALEAQGILGGYNLTPYYPQLGHAILVCATETKTEADLKNYAFHMERIISKRRLDPPCAVKANPSA